MFESIDDTIWVVSKNGEIIMVNKSSERLTGYSKEYMQGRNVSDFSPQIANVIGQLQSESTTPSVVTQVVYHSRPDLSGSSSHGWVQHVLMTL